eukprot:6295582-Pyramimonas_sp.AAC.1
MKKNNTNAIHIHFWRSALFFFLSDRSKFCESSILLGSKSKTWLNFTSTLSLGISPRPEDGDGNTFGQSRGRSSSNGNGNHFMSAEVHHATAACCTWERHDLTCEPEAPPKHIRKHIARCAKFTGPSSGCKWAGRGQDPRGS